MRSLGVSPRKKKTPHQITSSKIKKFIFAIHLSPMPPWVLPANWHSAAQALVQQKALLEPPLGQSWLQAWPGLSNCMHFGHLLSTRNGHLMSFMSQTDAKPKCHLHMTFIFTDLYR